MQITSLCFLSISIVAEREEIACYIVCQIKQDQAGCAQNQVCGSRFSIPRECGFESSNLMNTGPIQKRTQILFWCKCKGKFERFSSLRSTVIWIHCGAGSATLNKNCTTVLNRTASTNGGWFGIVKILQ